MMMGYIDPGSGSMILQLIAGSVIGGLFAVKCGWRRIRDFAVGLLHRNKVAK